MGPAADKRAEASLPTSDSSQHNERLSTRRNGFGQWSVSGLVREVLLAGEVADEGAAVVGAVVADGSAQGGVGGFERVEDGGDRHGRGDLEPDLVLHPRERAQVRREDDADGDSGVGIHRVCTSTERTAGRSRTIGVHESPPSGEQ